MRLHRRAFMPEWVIWSRLTVWERQQCPLWVISGHMQCITPCPLYSPKADMCTAILDVRFGLEADICDAQAHVRFAPESDSKCDRWGRPLRAKSRQLATDSITSS